MRSSPSSAAKETTLSPLALATPEWFTAAAARAPSAAARAVSTTVATLASRHPKPLASLLRGTSHSATRADAAEAATTSTAVERDLTVVSALPLARSPSSYLSKESQHLGIEMVRTDAQLA